MSVENQISACKALAPFGDRLGRSSDADPGESAADETAILEKHGSDDHCARRRDFPEQSVEIPIPSAVRELAALGDHHCWAVDLAVSELAITDCRVMVRKESEPHYFAGVSVSHEHDTT
jgi:hypothetical protein